MSGDTLRLDKFLWFARLAKTRELAQAIAEAGHARLDGRRLDRAHAPVRVGDVLSVPLPRGVRVVRVESLPRRRIPARAAEAVYTDLSRIDEAREPELAGSPKPGAPA